MNCPERGGPSQRQGSDTEGGAEKRKTEGDGGFHEGVAAPRASHSLSHIGIWPAIRKQTPSPAIQTHERQGGGLTGFEQLVG